MSDLSAFEEEHFFPNCGTAIQSQDAKKYNDAWRLCLRHAALQLRQANTSYNSRCVLSQLLQPPGGAP
eukprot:1987401-Amphidinium_carterae.1